MIRVCSFVTKTIITESTAYLIERGNFVDSFKCMLSCTTLFNSLKIAHERARFSPSQSFKYALTVDFNLIPSNIHVKTGEANEGQMIT